MMLVKNAMLKELLPVLDAIQITFISLILFHVYLIAQKDIIKMILQIQQHQFVLNVLLNAINAQMTLHVKVVIMDFS